MVNLLRCERPTRHADFLRSLILGHGRLKPTDKKIAPLKHPSTACRTGVPTRTRYLCVDEENAMRVLTENLEDEFDAAILCKWRANMPKMQMVFLLVSAEAHVVGYTLWTARRQWKDCTGLYAVLPGKEPGTSVLAIDKRRLRTLRMLQLASCEDNPLPSYPIMSYETTWVSTAGGRAKLVGKYMPHRSAVLATAVPYLDAASTNWATYALCDHLSALMLPTEMRYTSRHGAEGDRARDNWHVPRPGEVGFELLRHVGWVMKSFTLNYADYADIVIRDSYQNHLSRRTMYSCVTAMIHRRRGDWKNARPSHMIREKEFVQLYAMFDTPKMRYRYPIIWAIFNGMFMSQQCYELDSVSGSARKAQMRDRADADRRRGREVFPGIERQALLEPHLAPYPTRVKARRPTDCCKPGKTKYYPIKFYRGPSQDDYLDDKILRWYTSPNRERPIDIIYDMLLNHHEEFKLTKEQVFRLLRSICLCRSEPMVPPYAHEVNGRKNPGIAVMTKVHKGTNKRTLMAAKKVQAMYHGLSNRVTEQHPAFVELDLNTQLVHGHRSQRVIMEILRLAKPIGQAKNPIRCSLGARYAADVTCAYNTSTLTRDPSMCRDVPNLPAYIDPEWKPAKSRWNTDPDYDMEPGVIRFHESLLLYKLRDTFYTQHNVNERWAMAELFSAHNPFYYQAAQLVLEEMAPGVAIGPVVPPPPPMVQPAEPAIVVDEVRREMIRKRPSQPALVAQLAKEEGDNRDAQWGQFLSSVKSRKKFLKGRRRLLAAAAVIKPAGEREKQKNRDAIS